MSSRNQRLTAVSDLDCLHAARLDRLFRDSSLKTMMAVSKRVVSPRGVGGLVGP